LRDRNRAALHRVLPRLPQVAVGHLLAADEPVHDVLVPRDPELDDDVVDHERKSRVPDQRHSEGVGLFVAVKSFTERDDLMGLECVEQV
jgi:hypothetical protein